MHALILAVPAFASPSSVFIVTACLSADAANDPEAGASWRGISGGEACVDIVEATVGGDSFERHGTDRPWVTERTLVGAPNDGGGAVTLKVNPCGRQGRCLDITGELPPLIAAWFAASEAGETFALDLTISVWEADTAQHIELLGALPSTSNGSRVEVSLQDVVVDEQG